MQIGTIVRYIKKYPDGIEMDWIGIVIDCEIDENGSVVPHVRWNFDGISQWRYDMRELEVICE